MLLQLREYAVQLKVLVGKKCSEEEMKEAKRKMMTEVKKATSELALVSFIILSYFKVSPVLTARCS